MSEREYRFLPWNSIASMVAKPSWVLQYGKFSKYILYPWQERSPAQHWFKMQISRAMIMKLLTWRIWKSVHCCEELCGSRRPSEGKRPKVYACLIKTCCCPEGSPSQRQLQLQSQSLEIPENEVCHNTPTIKLKPRKLRIDEANEKKVKWAWHTSSCTWECLSESQTRGEWCSTALRRLACALVPQVFQVFENLLAWSYAQQCMK